MDERYEEVLVEHLKNSGLTKAAIPGQDAVYDPQGKVDWNGTSFYVPNDYVFKVVANWLKRDFDLKEALGIGRASAERAYELVMGK
jgi:hypothetical protein